MDSENVRAREGERSREKTRKREEIERRERGERWERESSSEEGSAERAKERSTPDCSNGHQISEMNLRTHNRHASCRIFLPSHISDADAAAVGCGCFQHGSPSSIWRAEPTHLRPTRIRPRTTGCTAAPAVRPADRRRQHIPADCWIWGASAGIDCGVAMCGSGKRMLLQTCKHKCVRAIV